MGKFMDMFTKVQQGELALKQMAKLKNNEVIGVYADGIGKVGEITPDPAYLEYAKADVEATHAFIEGLGDTRYNEPKEAPKADEELVEETIVATEIYRRARLAILQSSALSGDTRTAIMEAQRKQVGYGLDKYPEPLNPNTWTIGETVEHIMDESIDKLHYLIMLRIKLEQQLVSGAFNDILEVRNANSRIANITRMVDNTIEELHYLVSLVITTDRETERMDYLDAVAYSCKTMKNVGISMADLKTKMSGADFDGDKVLLDE